MSGQTSGRRDPVCPGQCMFVPWKVWQCQAFAAMHGFGIPGKCRSAVHNLKDWFAIKMSWKSFSLGHNISVSPCWVNCSQPHHDEPNGPFSLMLALLLHGIMCNRSFDLLFPSGVFRPACMHLWRIQAGRPVVKKQILLPRGYASRLVYDRLEVRVRRGGIDCRSRQQCLYRCLSKRLINNSVAIITSIVIIYHISKVFDGS